MRAVRLHAIFGSSVVPRGKVKISGIALGALAKEQLWNAGDTESVCQAMGCARAQHSMSRCCMIHQNSCYKVSRPPAQGGF